jgi:hypothetical protein
VRRGYQPTQRCTGCGWRYRRVAHPTAPCKHCGGVVKECEARDHLRGVANGAHKLHVVTTPKLTASAEAALRRSEEAKREAEWNAIAARLRATTDAVRPRLRGAS